MYSKHYTSVHEPDYFVVLPVDHDSLPMCTLIFIRLCKRCGLLLSALPVSLVCFCAIIPV